MIPQAAATRKGFGRASANTTTPEHLDSARGLVTGVVTGLVLWALGVAIVVSLRSF